MTVEELIKELEKLPKDAVVYACDCSYCGGTTEPAALATEYPKYNFHKHLDEEVIFIYGDYSVT